MSLIRTYIIKGHLIQCNYWLQVEDKSSLLSILACHGEEDWSNGVLKELRHFVCNRTWDEYLFIGVCVYRMPAESRCQLQITQNWSYSYELYSMGSGN